jgi:phage head maturation protease
MVEDSRGLRVKGRLVLESTRGKEAHALLKAGAINGLSIGFIAQKWSWDNTTDIRTLQAVDLWEVSPVTFPANGQARVDSVKSGATKTITTIREAERALRDAGLSADQAKATLAIVKRSVQAEREADQDSQRALRAAQQLLDSLKRAAT